MSWEEITFILQTVSAGMSIFLNTILIFLIIFRSPKQLGSYRYLMIYTALFEIFYSIVDVVISPQAFSHESIFFLYVSSRRLVVSKTLLAFMLYVWCGFFGGFMTLFCIQFIYRYLVIIGSTMITSFNDYRVVFWISIPILSVASWAEFTYLFTAPRSLLDNVLRTLFLAKSGDLTFDDIIYVGSQCYNEIEGVYTVDKHGIIAPICITIVMSCSLLCMIILAITTFFKIRDAFKISTASRKNNRIQTQTFYALVTQTLIPFILMHFPCATVFVSTLLNIDMANSSGIISITFALFPVLDPLPTMLIIKNYRETLWNVWNVVGVFVKTIAKR